MARYSKIDLGDVEQAVASLQSMGKPVNPYQIRQLIGMGSLAKIAELLSIVTVDESLDADDQLIQRLLAAVKPIAEQLIEERNSAIESYNRQHQNQSNDLQQQLSKLQLLLEGTQKEHQTATNQLSKYADRHAEMTQQLTLCQQERNAALERVAAQENEHKQQQGKLEQMAERLEQGHEVHLQRLEHERLANRRQISETEQRYQQQSEQQRSETKHLNQELLQSREKNMDLAAELREIAEQFSRKEQEFKILNNKLKTAEQGVIESNQESLQRQSENQQLQAQIDLLRSQLSELQKQHSEQIATASRDRFEQEQTIAQLKCKLGHL